MLSIFGLLLCTGTLAATAGAATPSPPFHQCPPVGSDTSCAILIYVAPTGAIAVLGDATQGPYEDIEDTLIGVQNDSSAPIASISLTTKSGTDLFGFDGDGLCTMFNAPIGCPFGATGYEGPTTSFTNITSGGVSGTVNFAPPIAPGQSRYFSLEEALDTVDLIPVPANTPPVANDDSYGVIGGATLAPPAPGVLTNDTDADGDPLTAQLVSGPSSGALDLHADGSFTYVPGEDTVGVVTFRYRAFDGTATSNVATVTITVTAGCDGFKATIVGTAGPDRIRATRNRDVIVGLGGNDDIDAQAGDDVVCGGSGTDELNGDVGRDRMFGGSGADDIKADAGDDVIYAGAGNDRVRGDDGDDTAYGGDGDDVLEGDSGRDRLFGENGVDRLFGGSDNDQLDGGTGGPDRCDGEGGIDTAAATCEVKVNTP